MSQSKPGPGEPADPSMEDILASIRRILNDGDTSEEAGSAEAHDAAPEPGPVESLPSGDHHQEPAEQEEFDDGGEDVFLLDPTMLIEETTLQPEEPSVEKEPVPFADKSASGEAAATQIGQPPPGEPLVAATHVAAASASLGALARVVGQRHTAVYRGGPTIEDVVRDEIRPIVKEWLDENLAPIVERMVRAEIERVTSGT